MSKSKNAMNKGPSTKSNSVQTFNTISVPIVRVRNGIPPSSIKTMIPTPASVEVDKEKKLIDLYTKTRALRNPLIRTSMALI
ncbi:hypothetical protein D9M69_584790 [compost metagenome]